MSNEAKHLQKRMEDLIASGEQLVKQADIALETNRRVLEAANVDPESVMREAQRRGGNAAVRAIQEQVQEAMTRIDEEISREILHATKPVPTGRRMRAPRNMI